MDDKDDKDDNDNDMEEMNMMKSVKAAVDMCGDTSFVLNTRADWINCQVPGQAEPTPMPVTERITCMGMNGAVVDEPFSCFDTWMWLGMEMEAGRMDEMDAKDVA